METAAAVAAVVVVEIEQVLLIRKEIVNGILLSF